MLTLYRDNSPKTVKEDEDESRSVEHVAGQQEGLVRRVGDVEVAILEDQVEQDGLVGHDNALRIASSSRRPVLLRQT